MKPLNKCDVVVYTEHHFNYPDLTNIDSTLLTASQLRRRNRGLQHQEAGSREQTTSRTASNGYLYRRFCFFPKATGLRRLRCQPPFYCERKFSPSQSFRSSSYILKEKHRNDYTFLRIE